MKRLINDQLNLWKDQWRRKPLVLRGARQVGKTYSVRAFGRASFDHFLEIDFERDRKAHLIFGGDLDARNLALQIEAYLGQPVVPGKSLLFFDEIQECPRALTALRYFYEQRPELHVVAAGSLLELSVADVSFPVGRVEFAWMRPLSFEEFLLALGMEPLSARIPSYPSVDALPEALHTKMLEQLRQYFLVGGMPEAVTAFVETHSLAEVNSVHRNLSAAYLQDFAKYSPRADRDCLQRVFEQIPRQVGKRIKYTALYPEKRVETIKSCLRILEQSLALYTVKATTAQGLPLGADASSNNFKVVFLDIGLMQHLCGVPAREMLTEKDLLNVYRGALAEQFVGQELLAHGRGSENGQLFYWSRTHKSSQAEVDFVIVREGKIIPVEVKSGPGGRLKSLQVFLEEHPHCDTAFILSTANPSDAQPGPLQFMPVYSRV